MNARAKNWFNFRALKGVRKLVIVAHPDDETFWAGATLQSGDWTSVCLTHRSTKWRRKAYRNALNVLGCKGVIFDLPDRRWDELSKTEIGALYQTIDRLLAQTSLTDVMTHSPNGETGHLFHKLISRVVTERIPEGVELWYFSFDNGQHLPRVNEQVWSLKEKAIRCYFEAMPGDPGNDILHARLGEYESPVSSDEYSSQFELIRSIYSGSSVPNASIED